ncbi:hypothetical protein BXT86_06290 [candidate division WOR-3 bacterium 4484_100]|uniref:Metallo-beta-lactamase domain-containing protein n=1 Tax=candidate division WOR-3 bacterium 4484_100 TaxID=1936077 RepID=A0A1V4QDR1_UNCW3|nr:MAG: hypothetical protein BXT86_06290 [candidate division WOR-3 bacterium 4484_100]
MKFGQFLIRIVSDGNFWLDGGAMFGVVPKVLWNKLNPADDQNRIKLALNCLLIDTGNKKVLIDTGVGEKLSEKFKGIYRVERDNGLLSSLRSAGVEPEDIDFVINTHLHFDHCGGNTRVIDKKLTTTFPRAKYVIQKKEWFDATHPNERTRASYLPENFIPIEERGQLILVEGDTEILPGINVILTNGHTAGHQSVLIQSEDRTAIYFGDLVPTTSHLKIPYIMGYDLFPLDIIEKKKEVLEKAMKQQWLLIFEHDPKNPFGYLKEVERKPVFQPI